MTPQELTDYVRAITTRDDDTPEGISLRVMTTSDAQARMVAPLLAQELYPDVRTGQVLHSEPMDDVSTEVVLEVL
jgi:hypothetical protein